MSKIDFQSKLIELNILQWNAQSVRPKLPSLEPLLYLEKIHIAVLCETWLVPGSHLKISNYNIYCKDRFDSYGGVAILAHRSIKATIYSFDSINPGIELLTIKVYNCEHIEFITTVYCAPNVKTNLADWEHIFGHLGKKSLIIGDFNGHHVNWCFKTDTRGSEIHDALLDSKYVSLNDYQCPDTH